MNIFVTGACGYKGTVLVPKLLRAGHSVTGIDTQWFGNFLQPHPKLELIKGDIRNVQDMDLKGFDAIIHLASIANDPTCDLNPKLTWETIALATMRLADKAIRSGVKRIIYASSGSVYGVKAEEQVTEDLELVPLSEYNKAKMVAERTLLSYQNDLVVQILRPATVCGLSPRMRLDVSVNLLTIAALTKGKITLHGGSQVRPNIHMQDITDLYLFMLDNPQHTGIFNAGFENLPLMEIAQMVSKTVGAPIDVTSTADLRSYRVNSDRLLKTGFRPKFTVNDAIREMVDAYKRGELKDEPHCHSLKWMLEKKLAN